MTPAPSSSSNMGSSSTSLTRERKERRALPGSALGPSCASLSSACASLSPGTASDWSISGKLNSPAALAPLSKSNGSPQSSRGAIARQKI